MFIKLLVLSIIFLALAAAGFGITMILKPRGRFPELHISNNKEMRKRGISCAQHTDTGCSPVQGFTGCASCSRTVI